MPADFEAVGDSRLAVTAECAHLDAERGALEQEPEDRPTTSA